MSTAACTAVVGPEIPNKEAAAVVNSFRLTSVTQRLRYHLQLGPKSENKDFQICCISLAKGIDFSIANNDIPKKVEELPWLIKQVCRHKSDTYTITVVMVLMISVKHACQQGWFPDSESQELIALADEMRNCFGSFGNTSTGVKRPGSIFSKILERYFPFVKIGLVLVSLEVKPGFSMLAHDFHISKSMPHSPQEKIRLFVAQIDNVDTSACIINPPEVSFMLNGKMVENRANIAMDTRPQLPSNVTAFLKYGTNLLQVMGDSNGCYIVILAFTGVVMPSEKPVLKDYIQSEVIESNPDSDIIEGPSRVSLKCPISSKRIKLPVKGQLCKHLQCFDYWNYVHINMRNPSWRCPHCNQPVCYPDIRLDQNMVKILKDAGQKATDVIIHSGGTWKVAKENDVTEEPMNDVDIHDRENPDSFFNSGQVVMDLTGDDDHDDIEMEVFDETKVVDRKPCLSDVQGQSTITNASQDGSYNEYCPDVHVPFSQTPSLRDRPTTTPNPSPQVYASPDTRTGAYASLVSRHESNTYQAPTITSLQGRRHPVSVTSQPNTYYNHVTTQRQHPSTPLVQSVSQASDLINVDTTNWRPRMRGSVVPGSYTPGLDHMIIQPTQQAVQTPQVQTSQAQTSFTPATFRPDAVAGNRNHLISAPPGFTKPSGPTTPWRS